MTDLTINERCAIAAGWATKGGIWWYTTLGGRRLLPDCEHSLDDGLALLWPVLVERGYYCFEWEEFPPMPGRIRLYGNDSVWERGEGPTPAVAFALACLQVLEPSDAERDIQVIHSAEHYRKEAEARTVAVRAAYRACFFDQTLPIIEKLEAENARLLALLERHGIPQGPYAPEITAKAVHLNRTEPTANAVGCSVPEWGINSESTTVSSEPLAKITEPTTFISEHDDWEDMEPTRHTYVKGQHVIGPCEGCEIESAAMEARIKGVDVSWMNSVVPDIEKLAFPEEDWS